MTYSATCTGSSSIHLSASLNPPAEKGSWPAVTSDGQSVSVRRTEWGEIGEIGGGGVEFLVHIVSGRFAWMRRTLCITSQFSGVKRVQNDQPRLDLSQKKKE